MGSTVTEKILARSAGRKRVLPGDVVHVRPDMLAIDELSTPRVYQLLKDVGVSKLYDPDRLAIVVDHRVPANDVEEAERQRLCRRFVREYGITHFYDIGRSGVHHQLAVEEGLALPGTVFGVEDDAHGAMPGAIGCFSTNWGMGIIEALVTGELWCRVPESIKFEIEGGLPLALTPRDIIQRILADIGPGGALYRAMEFTGDTVSRMSVGDRLALTNNVVAAGAKSGIVNPDRITSDYLKNRTSKPYEMLVSDPDAEYAEVHRYDVRNLEPLVAQPGEAHESVSIKEVEGIRVDQCAIGTCAGGRIEDLRLAAAIIRGRRVHPDTRLIVIPASREQYLKALEEGLIRLFIEAGAVVDAANCGFCSGAHQGVLAAHEVCISTGPVNLPGRMGSPLAEIYLASAATVAASAVEGAIADPRRYASEIRQALS